MFKKSFYDWCVETDNIYLLDLWDYELNNVKPNDIGFGVDKRCYFKCPKGIHESELYTISNITGDKHQKVTCRKCSSFGQWCVDNNHLDLLDRWDYELNSINPFEVGHRSQKGYYFKCPNNNPLHPSEKKCISNVVSQEGSRRCIACESFAQWGIDNIDKDFLNKYWSSKNTINSFTITFSSTTKVWIKCQEKDYHDDYQIMACNFVRGERCPYCAMKKVNYFDSLGYNLPISVNRWSDKNEKSPFEYGCYSNKDVWFKCLVHGEYKQKISEFTKKEGLCKFCMHDENISKYQRKTQDYLTKVLKYNVKHEYDCTITPLNPLTKCKLPFDNEIEELKLIIEVHGKQHYEIDSLTILSTYGSGKTPQEELAYQQWKDEYKKDYAIKNGYEYLELPYYAFNETNDYKTLIDNKINKILNKSNIAVTTAGGIEQSVS